jgi:hypothetical protein
MQDWIVQMAIDKLRVKEKSEVLTKPTVTTGLENGYHAGARGEGQSRPGNHGSTPV